MKADWEIARDAEPEMKTAWELGDALGLDPQEILPHGHFLAKLDYRKILERLKDQPQGHYIDVTAITPTPLGEGKSTTTIGLIQGLGRLGKRVTGAIRQPSMGPIFNIKGSAAGGGYAQCIPLSEFSLGLTGDFDAIITAHNLGMVALTSRMQHEFNYDDALLESKNLKRLNIDPRNLATGWVMDLCAQSLREIVIGMGGKMDGLLTQSGFQIAVSSELMAILSVANDLADLRARIAKMILAYDKSGKPVTCADLEVDGAMSALMVKALNPNLMQTLEGQPVLVHAGPFANIALGQSSILADRLGLKLADYHVTESGFGADIGFEKFWNLKCRFSGLRPSCAVIVATVRALKMHGGGPAVAPGKPLDPAYTQSAPELVEKGLENLKAHLEIVRQSGVPAVVCLNHFVTDSPEEVERVRQAVESMEARFAVSRHWELGGAGAEALAEAVLDACQEKSEFEFLYPDSLPLSEKIERIATRIYGAKGVQFLPAAKAQLKKIEADPIVSKFGTCMAKTHLSLSDNPALKGRPQDWELTVRELKVYQGAGFVVPVAGDIKLMPGTASDPAYRRIDVDTETGQVTGLF
ncbi:formate--tetrahydrofolate ligase [bacterium (Candidatus Blackallbacteria) CG17_big_fil_post_rev_8_21_14_2_50_48_46]|uniref:Formate--tetrahydrofolate ligase n=1 Tax=bacterium (Candidatus Blackallbacteria) CG17_big_fil_post_rev_8_21_14_2_50_48_46 TaxID=2014261 RepID=A0A2M7G061_9BACT|nr:MAG: formate--tetrahydrofolate ligase [bacterium (Candidatus Blackallbacteria) CG18_big_fil_WC_8_21_14_2_50_49_26]PIW15017.1 MAG: formate--tetrahydrofolate ligase [bacterium (Candidatus Blackallbacteria) CG17_big_fil_post_rev_8_21_14_2_50_48_46]PIW44834.1 MAG: formate--tetrahydrofolate ligase [bacterium (Candidatus Blackallbacteria) CG13_big_fil_rev_8_21_14_2_50_49_14]